MAKDGTEAAAEADAPPSETEKKRAAQLEQARELAIAIADIALGRKAEQVEIIDVVGKVDYADFVVLMSGRSDRQVAALAKNLAEDVRIKSGVKALSVEGLPQASWVLMDFGDVIVHVFHRDTRGYYDLEGLWIDAPRLPVPEER